MSDAPDFETALKRLEEIVRKLENGELSLDSALELFEEGVKLSRFATQNSSKRNGASKSC